MDDLSFPGATELRAEIQIGRLDIVASDRTDISVTVRPSNQGRSGDRSAAEAVRVDRQGPAVVVTGPFRLNLIGPGDSVDVVVEVPTGTAVSADVKYGSMHIAGRVGAARLGLPYGELTLDDAERLEVKHGHGGVRVGRVDGDAEVTTKSGSATLRSVGGALRLKGSDSALSVDHVAGPAELSTSSGSIDIGTAEGAVTVKAAYGTVRIRHLARGVTRIEGSYSGVHVGVRRGTAVWLDASSQHGTVRTDLASDAGPTEGEDTLELHVRTGYGNISVHRSEAPPGA
ncbi:DUF4097 family beta strand repeat-containing protein [Microbacterium sp. B2969]|uniref:DUF4097 family beta strand repeat-containing protein n=1 Tax=Microbacterium alkaliflavum TaxID=3248839 RepID=A0ABW7QA04_9MICO